MITRKKNETSFTSYQQYVIDYLTQHCTNQDGLLLYHYMGSGKTFTAVGLAVNIAMPVVLLAPSGLISMWKTEYFSKYKSIMPPVSKVLSYEVFWNEMRKMGTNGIKWRNKHMLIVDEAHNLSTWLSDKLPLNERHECLHYLQQFKKRVLLTGTPIYWSERDLSFLTNVASGKVLMPIDDNAFRKKYYKVIKSRSLVEGWVAPVSRDLFRLVGTATITAATSTVMYAVLPPGKMNQLMGLLQKGSVGITTVWYRTVCTLVKPLLEHVLKKVISNDNTRNWLHEHGSNKKHRTSHTAQKWRSQKIPTLPAFVARSLPISQPEIQMLTHWVTQRVMGRKQNLMLAGQAPYLILTLLLLYIMHAVIKRYFTREDDNELLKMDYNHLVNDIGPYISYYKPETLSENSSVWRRWLAGGPAPSEKVYRAWRKIKHTRHNSRGGGGGRRKHSSQKTRKSSSVQQATFPTVNSVIETVSYNPSQVALFMRYTLGKMSFEDYTQLTILENTQQGKIISFDQASLTNFRIYGRMIGNSCVFRKPNDTLSYSYFENIDYDTTRFGYCLRDKHAFTSVAPKLRALYKHFKSGSKRRVVYSNFNEASATLSAYLTKKNIPHRYLRDAAPDAESKRDDYDVIMKWVSENANAILILGKSYSEGLSVLNVDEMHIMEPCESVAKNDQTKGRVARLGSHPPGSFVRIIEWITTMSTMTKWLKSTKEWFAHAPYVWYTDLLTKHRQGITPDAVVYREVHRLSKSTDRVVRLLQSRSIEHYAKTGFPKRCHAQKHTLKQLYVEHKK